MNPVKNEDIVEEFLQALIMNNHIIKNIDGTYRLSEELHERAQKMINEHPELYAQIFPDRVN